jgi:heterodisulfide reductase subunit C2
VKKPDFLREAESLTAQTISSCYQCYKCTNGCPVAEEMDLYPHQVIRQIIMGERQRVLTSNALWVCLQCATCSVRCPNGIDVAGVLERLRAVAVREGAVGDRAEWIFDRGFVDSVRRNGRLHELGTILSYKIASHCLFTDLDLGMAMFRTGRLGLMSHHIKDRQGFREMLRRLDAVRARENSSGNPKPRDKEED